MKGLTRKNERGMALVITLLIVALLTAVVVEFAYGVYVSTSALHNWETAQRLSIAANSAVKLGARLISVRNSQQPGYSHPGLFEMSQPIPSEEISGTLTIRIEDESGKFNLNTLRGYRGVRDGKSPYEGFVRLLKAVKLDPDIADRISYWVDSRTDHRPSDRQAKSKDAVLDSIDELLVIPGITPEIYERLKPYVTIYGFARRINFNAASVPVLMSVSDSITQEMAEAVVTYRETMPFQNLEDINKISDFPKIWNSLQGYASVSSDGYRVVTTAESNGIKRIVDSVLDGSGKIVRFWREA